MCVLARSVFHNYACGPKDHLAQGSEPLLKLFILSSIRCVLVLRAAKYMTLPYAHLLKKTKSSLTSCIPIGFVLIESRATFDFFYEKKTVRETSKMTTSFPGSLLFLPAGARERRPLLGLVTCLPEKSSPEEVVVCFWFFFVE